MNVFQTNDGGGRGVGGGCKSEFFQKILLLHQDVGFVLLCNRYLFGYVELSGHRWGVFLTSVCLCGKLFYTNPAVCSTWNSYY